MDYFWTSFAGTKIGIYSIALGIVGLAAGFLEKNFSKDSKITVIIITSVLTILFETIIFLLIFIFNNITNSNILVFVKILLIEVLYNNIIIIIIYPLFQKFGTRLEEHFINKNFLDFL